MRRRSLWPLVGPVLALAAGCAKISSPVGGVQDKEPPRVAATLPEGGAVVPGWDREVVIRFDERISERRVEEAVLVSPETGKVRVKKGRSELRVSLDGGWKQGKIYRVTVLPVLQDLFGNPMKDPIELIFSTGPEIPPTAVAGVVTDRLTGKPVPGARVEAVSEADSTIYVALADTAGFYALRHIPVGGYEIRAYLDQNRSRKLEFGKPEARETLSLAAADTSLLAFSLLAADTTPARVVRAEARDSLEVRVSLDDYLDPEMSLDSVRAELWQLPDSTPVAVAKVYHVHAFERILAERRAAAAADSARQDSIRAAALPKDSAKAGEAKPGAAKADGAKGATPPAAAKPAAADTAAPLPSRDFVVVPTIPLEPKTRFRVVVERIKNINGLAGGGGSAPFETPARVARDSAQAVRPDSTRAPRPDTTKTPPPPRR
jgi:hypothetical protein